MGHLHRGPIYAFCMHASLPSTTYAGHGIYDEILAYGRQIYEFFQSDVQEITTGPM